MSLSHKLKFSLMAIAAAAAVGIMARATFSFVGGGRREPQTNTNLPEKTRILRIMTTAYDKKSSCHNPKDGKCLTAAGTIAREGVVACPRNWKLGAKLYMDKKIYTCEDRYSKRLSPRLDIWMENGATEWGVREKEVIYQEEAKNRF